MKKLIVSVLACSGVLAIITANEIGSAVATSDLAKMPDRFSSADTTIESSGSGTMETTATYGGAGAAAEVEFNGVASIATPLPRSSQRILP